MNIKTIDEYLNELKTRKAVLEEILDRYGVDYGDEKSALFRTECNELKKLKVAAIMDAFTLGNFRSECELLEVTAENWQAQLDEFRPDLFFLESAWEGKDKSWYKKIANGSKELYDLTAYCHAKNIPVIFWNKEDPVYTDVFMSAASCADYVFTTDFDCIERYKRTLQHNNVYLLHFSAQPLVHNPVEMHDRKDKFCFAGAYYHRYKDRSRVFDAFADAFDKGKGLEIYDRNLGSARPEHAFPQRYNKMIVGTLKPDDIHIAYKGYNYGINMNSVGQSQTMFARRVYELLASNTVSVGNYARGVRNIFGDLTVATDSADTMQKQLDTYCGTMENYRKFRLLGLRKVLKDHLCEDRLGFIAQCVFGKDMRQKLPAVTVVSSASTDEEKLRVQKAFDRQTYENRQLIFAGEEADIGCGFVAAFSPDDYYGENYLLDLVLSVRYSNADGFGKVNFYSQDGNTVTIDKTDDTYKPCNKLFSTRSMVKKELVSDVAAFAQGIEINGEFFCTDEFSYCRNCKDEKCDTADDIFVADTGISLDVINKAAESIQYQELENDTITITAKEMLDMNYCKSKNVAVSLVGSRFTVTSKLSDDSGEYIELKKKFSVSDFSATGNITVMFAGSGELSTESFCTFFDSAMNRLKSFSAGGNRTLVAEIPEKAQFFALSIRARGTGTKEFAGVTISGGASAGNATPFLSRSDTVVVADHYPSYDDLYRYMFVHKRNLLYKEQSLVPDMLCINMWGDNGYREFENMNVTDGGADKLTSILENGRIKTVCVHFLNPYLWSVLKNYLDEINLIVWSHGSDIQPWHRRMFNYKTDADIENAKKASVTRENLWKEVFEYSENHNIHFVYVSEFFKKQIEEDYGVNLDDRCSIIHNCIDTQLFSYEKKAPEQRFNIMSVKSFSTLTYANDITQKAIEILSKEKEFSQMTFDLYGDGERFDTDTANIKKFPNVHLHRGFLTQSQIAQLHKTHGIYIATTRMDTQGVSRDEAMSSGLVPVANAVAAIPEFVNEDCGILAPAEDAQAVADGILKLVRNPDLFMQMSQNAAEHVRNKTSQKYTINKEVDLIKSRRDEK
ncbi:MAG: glycosyltransferase [Clostridia bacterium]|nr:glycosyltransferase [Clostridia bacterium]